MTPLMISVVAFLAVSGRGRPAGVRASRRRARARSPTASTSWSASGRRRTTTTDILQEDAFESDKKSLAGDSSRPTCRACRRCSSRPTATSSRARCSASACCWRARARRRAGWRGCRWFFAPLAGLVLFLVPFALAAEQAARPPEEVRRASCPTPWSWWPGPCVPAIAWAPACTSSPRKCRRPSPTSSAGFTRNRTWASPSRIRCATCASACPTSTCASS